MQHVSLQTEQHLVAWLLHHERQRPEQIALRHKQYGLWQQWTWAQLLHRSEQFATALQGFGFQAKQRLFIVSQANIDVVSLSLAVQALGGTVHLLQQDDDASVLQTWLTQQQNEHQHQQHQQRDAAYSTVADYVLLEHAEQIAAFSELHPSPIYFFYHDAGLSPANYAENTLATSQLLAEAKSKHQVNFQQLSLNQNQAAFVFEPVTTGQTQQVLHYADLAAQAIALQQQHGINAQQQAFIARAFSGQAHIRYLWSSWLYNGFTLNIPETLATRDLDRQVIAPTLVLGTAVTYARVQSLIEQRLPQSPALLQQVWQAQLYDQGATAAPSQSSTLWQRLLQSAVWPAFKQVILAQLGFTRLNIAAVVGEFPSPRTTRFFQGLGVELQHWSTPNLDDADGVHHQPHEIKQPNAAEDRANANGVNPANVKNTHTSYARIKNIGVAHTHAAVTAFATVTTLKHDTAFHSNTIVNSEASSSALAPLGVLSHGH